MHVHTISAGYKATCPTHGVLTTVKLDHAAAGDEKETAYCPNHATDTEQVVVPVKDTFW